MALLEIRDFHKSFGKTEVLKGIDLTVGKGETLAVIGSSGSGKTTLLRCLNFLVTPDRGRMYLDGKLLFDAGDAKKLKEDELRERRLHFGLVFQNFNLFPQYTVKENLCLAPKLRMREDPEMKDRAKRAAFLSELDEKAECLLRKVGLSDRGGAYPCELSGGQQQRVAIARALALSPDILCFDESTSALDPELTAEVLKVMRSLAADRMTMIVVTHEMSFAAEAADRILFMDGGEVEFDGPSSAAFGPGCPSERLRAFIGSVSGGERTAGHDTA
ncbi:MAG: amino acid ABC transporter ATP-binding protein [Clostridia bacterium]|nr:amino acid ABC transporter ATP-binding protein [Clostridia bacterium]